MTTTRYAPASRIGRTGFSGFAAMGYLSMCRVQDRAMAELADDGAVPRHFHIDRHNKNGVKP